MTIHSAIRNVLATLCLAMLVGCQADMSSTSNPTSTGEASSPSEAARTAVRVICPEDAVVRDVKGRSLELLVTSLDPRSVHYTVTAMLGTSTHRVASVPASSLLPTSTGTGAYLKVYLDNLPSTIWSDVGGATFVVEGWSSSAATGTPLSTQSFLPNRFRGTMLLSSDNPYTCTPYDQGLFPGEYLLSPSGNYRLSALGNGKLSLAYRISNWMGTYWVPVWTRPNNKVRGPVTLVMQQDGNLVTYDKNVATWASMRFGPLRRMFLQDDGNIVVSECAIFGSCRAVWNRITDPSTEF